MVRVIDYSRFNAFFFSSEFIVFVVVVRVLSYPPSSHTLALFYPSLCSSLLASRLSSRNGSKQVSNNILDLGAEFC